MAEFLQAQKNAEEEEEQEQRKSTTKQGHDEETQATPTMFHVLRQMKRRRWMKIGFLIRR